MVLDAGPEAWPNGCALHCSPSPLAFARGLALSVWLVQLSEVADTSGIRVGESLRLVMKPVASTRAMSCSSPTSQSCVRSLARFVHSVSDASRD